jgi:uncharacterized protein YehS (DUF1456 family)
MDNNDVLRKVRYALDLKDSAMVKIFKSVGIEMSRNDLSDHFVDEEDPFFKPLSNETLLAFLDGLILDRRGEKDGK